LGSILSPSTIHPS